MSQALAEAGAKAIALLDVKQELGDKSATELHRTTGIPVQFYKVDVRDAKAILDVVDKVNHDLGSVDIVINSAGIVEYGGSRQSGRPSRSSELAARTSKPKTTMTQCSAISSTLILQVPSSSPKPVPAI